MNQTEIKNLLRSLSNAERNLTDEDLLECFGNNECFVERFRSHYGGRLIQFFCSLTDTKQNDFLGFLMKKHLI